MSARLEKTIARVRQRIADGQFYEAHQALRTVAARYVKAEDYDQAIELLFHGARELLVAGQGGSGGDLASYMITTYKSAKVPVDTTSKARAVLLFNLFHPEEPRRKEFVHDVIQWSATGTVPYGDPELFHIIGTAYANEDLPYDAEKMLLLGTKDSAAVLAQLLYDWSAEDPDVELAPFYISRAVLGYLTVGNIRDARHALDVFISRLVASPRLTPLAPAVRVVSTASGGELNVFPDLPLLNFFDLLIRSCQRRSPDMFRRLRFRYKSVISDAGAFDEALDRIGDVFFGIKVRNQGNILQDLMGSLFSGGSQGPAPRTPQIQGADMD
ncbi:uncharacterized protein V1518DRAFT_418354 [Limtongia smithiae]|uniref:uncharacterized protein n=1 Tax=Limtongia smithiae TaxID=1125753 RepID=UPI0034CDED43